MAEVLHPADGACCAAGGVDDELPVQFDVADADAGHPIACGVAEQPFDDGLVVDVDIGRLRHPATNGPFEKWSRHGRAVQARRRSSLHAIALVPEEVVAEVELDCACPDELVGESWEPLLEQSGAGDEQQVGMASLRHEATRLWAVGQGVAVEDDHMVEPVGQDPSGAESRHAGAEHDRLAANVARLLLGSGGGAPSHGSASCGPVGRCRAEGRAVSAAEDP